MVLSNIQIFTHIGIGPDAAHRNDAITDFLSGGLEGLEHVSNEDFKDVCTSYAKHSDGNFPVILTTLQKNA